MNTSSKNAKTIAICNAKGGVGKTASAASLIGILVSRGHFAPVINKIVHKHFSILTNEQLHPQI